MLNSFIKGIAWCIKSVWNLGVKVPTAVYEWIAVGLIVLGLIGLIF